MSGGTVTAAAILNDGGYDIQGNGQITTTGVLTNDKLVVGNNLTLILGGLDNTGGTLEAAGGDLTVRVPVGFVNASGTTLSGGSYSATGADSNILFLDIGAEITIDAANISLNGRGEIEFYDNGSASYVPIQSTLKAIAATGSLSLANGTFSWGSLAVDGVLTLSNDASATTLTTTGLAVDPSGVVDGGGTINGPIDNSGTIVAGIVGNYAGLSKPSALNIQGPITGDGTLKVAAGTTVESFGGAYITTYEASLELGGATSENVEFGNSLGSLQLDDPTGFTGKIEASSSGIQITLAGVSLASVTSHKYVGDTNAGTLSIDAGGTTYSLQFVGDFATDNFLLSAGPQVFSYSPPSLNINLAPTVTSLTSATSTGTLDLHAGDSITFTMHISSDVYVPLYTTSLNLSNGAQAERTGGSGNTLTFQYTVSAGDTDTADLKVVGGAYALDFAGNRLVASSVVEDTGVAVYSATPPNIVNNNERASILWRNANGDTELWNPNSSGGFVAQDLGIIDNSWQIAGTVDFVGSGGASVRSGAASILWRNANGDTELWNPIGTGGFVADDLGVIDNGWQIAGTGNFTGTGHDSILWRSANGDTELWNPNGSGGFVADDLGTIDNSWQIVGTGSFTGTGQDSILWRNANGDTELWNPSSGGFVSHDLGIIDNSWQIAGTGNFSGTGQDSILWRNANGDTELWNPDGSGGFVADDLGIIDNSWQIAGTGDFTGTGHDSILWRNANGDTELWNPNGAGKFLAHDLGIVNGGWSVQKISA